jgi:hypothetical protein
MRAKITKDMRSQLDLMISSSEWPMERASCAASIIGSIRLGSLFFTLPTIIKVALREELSEVPRAQWPSSGFGVRLTRRWREMDSNLRFRYRSALVFET